MSLDLPTGPSAPTDYDRVRAKADAAREDRDRKTAASASMLEPMSYGSAVVSQAISMKRIADALDLLAKPPLVFPSDLRTFTIEPSYGAGDPPPGGGAR